jgi:hypothetical protein
VKGFSYALFFFALPKKERQRREKKFEENFHFNEQDNDIQRLFVRKFAG